MTTDPDRAAILFVQSAYQYYATARWAAHANCLPVCGNLFHHAVEMFLKGGLARNCSLDDLSKMKHDLKKLWAAFKTDFSSLPLTQHDRTISRLNKFEKIRYPDAIIKSGMQVTVQWSGSVAEMKVGARANTPEQYVIVVSDIDHLIADVMKSSSWNPSAFVGTSPLAQEAIKQHNDHAEFLTRP